MGSKFLSGVFSKGKPRNIDDSKKLPMYQIETDDYLVLIKLCIALNEKDSEDKVHDAFFSQEAEKVDKLGLERLIKNGVVEVGEQTVNVADVIKAQLMAVVNSFYCVSFSNSKLYKKGATIVFYFFENLFVAVLSDNNDTIIVSSENSEEVLEHYKEDLLNGEVVEEFLTAYWQNGAKWDKENYGKPITLPSMACSMGLGSGVLAKTMHNVVVVGDGEKVQSLCSIETAPREIRCKTLGFDGYYGEISKEIGRLKIVYEIAMKQIEDKKAKELKNEASSSDSSEKDLHQEETEVQEQTKVDENTDVVDAGAQ